jgi:beta-galactosidase GanA
VVLHSLDVMRRAGIAAVRTGFIWNEIEPSRRGFLFRPERSIVGEAAKRGISVLPVVSGVPVWAVAGKARNPALPLAREADRAAFLRALFGRYRETVPVWEFRQRAEPQQVCSRRVRRSAEMAFARRRNSLPGPR